MVTVAYIRLQYLEHRKIVADPPQRCGMALIIFCRSPVLPVLSNIGAIVVDGKVDGGAGGPAASGATGGAAGGATGGPAGSPGPAPTGYHNQVAPPHSAVVALQQVAMHQVLLVVERTHALLIWG